MTHHSLAGIADPPVAPSVRTALSIEFETHWRALAKEGLIPNRTSFRPERAARFLRHLVLCDTDLEGTPAIAMRLIGSEFESRILRNVKGEDYLQFLPEIYHRGAMNSVREIIERPCGLWQVMPLHYAKGFERNVEITVLPLKPQGSGQHQLLILTQFMGGPLVSHPVSDRIIRADTAVTYRYIDVGAGVPP